MTRKLLLLAFCAACSTPTDNKVDPNGPAGPSNTVDPGPTTPTGEVVVPEPTDVTTQVGPEGGVVTLGKLRLSFPPGTVDQTVSLRLYYTNESVDGYTTYSPIVHFEPEDLVLHSPIILEMPFEADGVNAKLYWNTATGFDEIAGVVVSTIFAAVIDRLGHGFVGFKIPVIVNLTPPSPPTNVVAHAGDTEVDVTWSASAGASSYKVAAGSRAGGPYTTLGSSVTTKFTHQHLQNDTTYYYIVKANNADGDSAPSAEASAIPSAIEPPDVVTAVGGDGVMTVSWTPPLHASTNSSYIVYRTAEGASGPTALTSTAGVQISDTAVTNGVTYVYEVKAVGPAPSGSTSGFSDPSSSTAFPYALVPTGSFSAQTGAGCASGITGATGSSGVYTTTACAPCSYAVRFAEADPQATFYKVALIYGSGDPYQSSVLPISAASEAFICQYKYTEGTAESALVTVGVSTCYGPSGTRCTDPDTSSTFGFLALDGPTGSDNCFEFNGTGGTPGLSFACPFP